MRLSEDAVGMMSPGVRPLALACLRSYPPERMEAYPVSPSIDDVRNDGPELVAPLPS